MFCLILQPGVDAIRPACASLLLVPLRKGNDRLLTGCPVVACSCPSLAALAMGTLYQQGQWVSQCRVECLAAHPMHPAMLHCRRLAL